MRNSTTERKIENLFRSGKQLSGRVEGIERRRDSLGSSGEDRACKSTASEVTADQPWYKNGEFLVQLALALLALFALLFNAMSYNLSRRSTQNQLRAWINPYDFTVKRDFSSTTPSYIQVRLKNNGPTPALDSEITFDLRATGFRGGRCRHLVPHLTNEAAKGAIGPGEIIYTEITLDPLPQACIEDLKSRASTFVVYGSFRYKDIFGQSRFTNFCAYTMPNQILSDVPIVTACAEHNEIN